MLLWLCGTLSMLILISSGIAWALTHHLTGSLSRIDVFGALRDRPAKGGDATSFLIVGSDAREGLGPEELKRLHAGGDADGARSDTVILVHISGKRDRATVVSFPRDSFVQIPDFTGRDGKQYPGYQGKLNSAYETGGAPLTVSTIEKNTGIRIDHYVEVNFASFVNMVDALGGVDVCTPQPIDDAKSGLSLPAGTSHVDGVTGLKYVRARYSIGDGSDLGRIHRQQNFIAAMLQQATSSGTLLNPVKLRDFVDAATGSLRTDPGLSPADLLDLATTMRGVSTGAVSLATVPVADMNFQAPGWGSAVLWDQQGADRLFGAIRDDRAPELTSERPASGQQTAPSAPPSPAPTAGPGSASGTGVTVPPGEVRVRVLNGSGAPGLAGRATEDLRRVGFVIDAPAANAVTTGAKETVIYYDPAYDVSARTVAAALPGARLEAKPDLESTIWVVAGSSYTTARKVVVEAAPAATAAAAQPPLAPESTHTRTADQAVCPR